MTVSILKPLLLLILFSLLFGCSRSPQYQLEDYLDRIARVTEVSKPDATPIPLQRHSVTLNIEAITAANIGLLDFLKISHCRYGKAVAHKNSQLGKVAAYSQQMHTERDMLIMAPECIAALLEESPQLANKLSASLNNKTKQRMFFWWNAWFASKEWQSFISPANTGIEFSDRDSPEPAHLSLSLQALDYAIHQGENWQQQEYPYSSTEMEFQLQQLLLGESLGKWLRSMQLLTDAMQRAESILQQSMAKGVLCPHGRGNKKADIMHNVFVNIYAGRFQPYLSRVHRFGNRLIQRLETIATMGSNKPFKQWLQDIKQRKAAMEAMNLKHVKAWQATLAQCGQKAGFPA